MHTVHKIGGSVLKNPEQLQKIAASFENDNQQHTLVVSALYGVTDMLSALCSDTDSAKWYIEQLLNRHFEWTYILLSGMNRIDANRSIVANLHRLQKSVKAYAKNGNEHLKAYVISEGERLAAIVLHAFFNKQKSRIVFPENSGIKTTFNPLDAEYLIDEVELRAACLNSDFSNIIPGFYGIATDGQICVVGRGGTDYTAAEVATKLGANRLIFWKDSNGLQTADPRLVKYAGNVEHVSLHTLDLMSYAGSEVLHRKVTQVLANSSCEIGFCNPLLGQSVLTQVHREYWASGKPIMVVAHPESSPDSSVITVITRNVTKAIIHINEIKTRCPKVSDMTYGNDFVRFSVPPNFVAEALVFMHRVFFSADFKTHKVALDLNELVIVQ